MTFTKESDFEETLNNQTKEKVFYEYMDATKVPMAGYVDDTGKYVKGIEDYLPKS